MYNQMSDNDRYRVKRTLLKMVFHKFPHVKDNLHRMRKTMRKAERNPLILWRKIEDAIGRAELRRLTLHAITTIENQLIQERKTLTQGCICRGCLSFYAQVKCKTCNKICLCSGCAEYACSAECESHTRV